MNSKYFSLVTTFFLSVSTLVFGQDSTFNTYQLKLNTEVSVSVPGEVYYSDENGVEVILNDDFELWIDVFKGESYEYFPDLLKIILSGSPSFSPIK